MDFREVIPKPILEVVSVYITIGIGTSRRNILMLGVMLNHNHIHKTKGLYVFFPTPRLASIIGLNRNFSLRSTLKLSKCLKYVSI